MWVEEDWWANQACQEAEPTKTCPPLGDRPSQVELLGKVLVSGGMLAAELGRQTQARETALEH
jgi:hypothetical protein